MKPLERTAILASVLERRRVPLIWAAVLLVVFAAIAWLSVGRAPALGPVDAWGRDAHSWANAHPRLMSILHVVEILFSTWPVLAATAVIAGVLWWRNHRRAAGYLVGVMLTATLLNRAMKYVIDRDRPEWQWLTDVHESQSFPSGHATSIGALSAALVVLSVMFARRANQRQQAYLHAAVAVTVVCADRVLLGRHYPSDVVAGVLLGVAVALLWIVLSSPLPRTSVVHVEETSPASAPNATRRLSVILNPIKVEDPGQFRAIVTSMALESGWSEPHWHYTSVEDSGTGMARAALEGGADLVLVCGGDGTVREVCATLAGTGTPVGIIPAGTGNLLARNLDIPLYLRAAIDVGLSGQDRAVDIIRVSGDGFVSTQFLVMAGMGFDAAIMEGVNEDIKKHVGWPAYVLSASKSLMYPEMKLQISVDGGPFTTHRARTAVIGNVGYLQAGMPLLPDATIDDGRMDLVLLHPKRFLSWVPLAVRVMSKSQRTDELVDRFTGAEIVVRAAQDVPRQLDGDTIGAGRELRMRCIPGHLVVRVPR